MTPQHYKALEIIAALPGERIEANTLELRQITDALYEFGYLNINPPGWCYVVNDAGRKLLTEMPAAPEAPPQASWRRRTRTHALWPRLSDKKARAASA